VTVDVHAHVVVPELLRDAQPSEAWRPRVYREAGAQVVELGGRPIRSAVEEFVDAGQIVAHQERAGIDRTVLCPWVPLLFYDAEPEEGLRRCRMQNDGLRRLVRGHPDRIGALGAVPLQDPELAAIELRALMEEGELAGVEIAASVRGDYLGHDRLEPFWSAAEQTGALVFVHPTTRGFDAPVFGEHYLWNALGNPLETTITAAHMTLAGVMERHPGLRVLLAHGGGALLALRGRLQHAHSFQPQARSRLTESPEDSIRRFFFDTVTHDPDLLRQLVEFVGHEQVLLGTDYPFDMGDLRPLDTLRASRLQPAATDAIAAGNASRLLGAARGGREEMFT
jgi:aminocarboxymuconate-semialdehyde decarboxylase